MIKNKGLRFVLGDVYLYWPRFGLSYQMYNRSKVIDLDSTFIMCNEVTVFRPELHGGLDGNIAMFH